ncbi:hypothetical protein ABRY23_03150 [Melioribacteraceae bacterium 4301-Me]|uniref:hypothetical protein n=1 Tax=Pyranulibacter aquaticus TaxID=3163344 RepID=UPI00359629C1
MIDFTKQYVIQCIVTSANQLRLSSEKIEVIALLKEHLLKCDDIYTEIQRFKKITELSKLGIKISEIISSIDNGKIDFLKISDKFKEHSSNLVREISYLLDIVNPERMKKIIESINEKTIQVDLTKRETKPTKEFSKLEQKLSEINLPKRSRADEIKEELIFEELNKELGFNFENYEEAILKPIKTLDSFLERVAKYNYTEHEMNSLIKLMEENAQISQKIGFEIISNMHKIFKRGLEMIKEKKISPSRNVIESLRACLIVIVAVVRGKEVDITNYLNMAENFGKIIFSNKKVI